MSAWEIARLLLACVAFFAITLGPLAALMYWDLNRPPRPKKVRPRVQTGSWEPLTMWGELTTSF